DVYGAELAIKAREAGSEIFSYGLGTGEFRAEKVSISAGGMQFLLVAPSGNIPIDTRLTGKVNVITFWRPRLRRMRVDWVCKKLRQGQHRLSVCRDASRLSMKASHSL